MRIVFVTQTIDADHPALAQTIDMVRALAARSDEVVVLCADVRRHDLPANVLFRTFAAGSRLGRGIRFVWALTAVSLRRRPDAVLAHMVPLFLVLAAPIARARRIPLVLWYTHWKAGGTLRLAARLADVVLSADRRSFPIESPKARGIGHAIDVSLFPPRAEAGDGSLRLLALGRFARWKGYETLLEGLRLAVERGVDVTLEIRGPALTDSERRHQAELEECVRATEGLRERVTLAPPVARDEIPALLAGADALVSPTQPDSGETLDKVVYEAAAAAVPVIASNPALAEFLGGLPLRLEFRRRDAGDLADVLVAFAAAPPRLRTEVGRELRRRVEHGHSVESWADAVVEIVREL